MSGTGAMIMSSIVVRRNLCTGPEGHARHEGKAGQSEAKRGKAGRSGAKRGVAVVANETADRTARWTRTRHPHLLRTWENAAPRRAPGEPGPGGLAARGPPLNNAGGGGGGRRPSGSPQASCPDTRALHERAPYRDREPYAGPIRPSPAPRPLGAGGSPRLARRHAAERHGVRFAAAPALPPWPGPRAAPRAEALRCH